MSYKRIAPLLLGLTLTVLSTGLSACESKDSWSSSPASAPTATSEPTPTPEATATPEPTQEPTPTPEPTPSMDVDALFAENPIDAQKNEDLANAFTAKDAYLAFQTAREKWVLFVDRLTDTISNQLLEGQEKEEFDQAAEAWSLEKDEALQSVLEGSTEEELLQTDLDKATEASSTVMSLCRDRAQALCKKYAELTGHFPDFEALLSDAPMG